MRSLNQLRPSSIEARTRIVALDAVRGLAIAGMLAVNNPGVPGMQPRQLRHSSWNGFTAADAIFPMFLFAVGASIPLSSSSAKWRTMARRTALLLLLGFLLSSVKRGHVVLGPGVLQRIAVAYALGWLVTRAPTHWWIPASAAILALVWAAYAVVPAPGIVPGSWAPGLTIADYVDGKLLGGFSSEGVIGTIAATVNVVAGATTVIRMKRRPTGRTAPLVACATGLIVIALALNSAIPINKKLWTPSYAVLGVGVSVLIFGLLDRLTRSLGNRWVQPLVIMGRNPIALYVVASLAGSLVLRHLRPFLVRPLVLVGGSAFASVAYSFAIVVAGWAFCQWLYGRGAFVRV